MDKLNELIIKIEDLKLNKDFDNAINVLEENIIKYNNDYRLYEELADIYIYKGTLTKALKAVNFSLSIADTATGNYLKGFILLTKENYKEAIIYLDKSNKLSGNNPEVLRNLGWAYNLLGETEKGIFILRRALILAPDDELIIEDLAIALIGVGKINEGNTLLEKIGKEKILNKI